MENLQLLLEQTALTNDEYDLIVRKIGRDPNVLELGLFGALWSEHCGYKHSKSLLRTFPNDSEAVKVKAGEENAGVIDIGDGLGVVFCLGWLVLLEVLVLEEILMLGFGLAGVLAFGLG